MTYDEIIEQLEITKSKIKEIARNEYGGESWNDDLDALTEAADIVADYSKAETKYGEIILDEAYAGEVYVNGLFVDCNSDLKYGYNFKPKYIRLERDRKNLRHMEC